MRVVAVVVEEEEEEVELSLIWKRTDSKSVGDLSTSYMRR